MFNLYFDFFKLGKWYSLEKIWREHMRDDFRAFYIQGVP